jgi:hypothetical protein
MKDFSMTDRDNLGKLIVTKYSSEFCDITTFEIPIFNIIELEREQCCRFQEIVTVVSLDGEKFSNWNRSPQIRYTVLRLFRFRRSSKTIHFAIRNSPSLTCLTRLGNSRIGSFYCSPFPTAGTFRFSKMLGHIICQIPVLETWLLVKSTLQA